MKLAHAIYTITTNTKFESDWGLRDQIRRAAVSIPSNIAEGYERDSDGDFNRFILIAKGSSGELRTQLLLAVKIGYINENDSAKMISECIEISSMLRSLANHLQNKINNRKLK